MQTFQVERRQRVVLKTAEHSSAIVSSLFPENVRDRAFPAQPASTKGGSRSWKHDTNGNESYSPIDSLPVADLFQDCTVLFADIV